MSGLTKIDVLERLGLHKSTESIDLEVVKIVLQYEIKIRYLIVAMIFFVLCFLGMLVIFRSDISWPAILFQYIVMALLGFGAGVSSVKPKISAIEKTADPDMEDRSA